MDTILYSNQGGEGYILDKPLEASVLDSVELGSTLLQPGKEYDLDGYFASPLQFVGQTSLKTLVFFIGEDTSLFGTTYYYQVLHWLSPTRFFSMFTFNGGRDFNFVNGKFK